MGKPFVNIVVDCDEVLVNINKKWFNKFASNLTVMNYIEEHNPELYNELYFKNLNTNVVSIKYDFNINNRDEYNMLSVINSDVDLIHKEIKDIFYSVYYDDKYFYDDLPPSKYFQAILNISNIHPDFIDQINIITHCGENVNAPCNISKKKWLGKHFKLLNENIEKYFHFLTIDQCKGEYIAKNIPNFTSFVDDSLKNVLDVLNAADVKHREILIPLYGYNGLFLDKTTIERNESVSISYFENVV